MSKPEYEIILPLNDLAGMLSIEDLETTIQNAELNDRVRQNVLLDDSVTFEGPQSLLSPTKAEESKTTD
ncbi:heterokaryon incompatibility protein [Colletotrichum tofieldiae]|nr:heterokaryon incompatibility protein [Colletotrichum tofieldiae]GKT81331.1 heterokaryon incompatibility protein [Colletotrichum tofieldiae]GKT84016.1 heterokaryon incompatibility protein [Colletotrichum tofieldiae]